MRIKSLDFIRGIAILLVLGRHTDPESIFKFIGWSGVDLFFVLSGFIISSVVINEYKEKNKVDFSRFLIHRGFKIYPSFYIFILTSIAFYHFTNHAFYDWKIMISELFFLQSYLDRIWSHTWSIAIEEHFYFGAAILGWIVIKNKWIERKKIMIPFLFMLIIAFTSLRILTAISHKNEASYAMFATHLRIDGILTGVLVAYLYYFTETLNIFFRRKFILLMIALICMIPLFIFKGGSFFMNTAGITLLNISFSLFILFAIRQNQTNKKIRNVFTHSIFSLVAFIGFHSYSIYLWHLMIKKMIDYYKPDLQIETMLYLLLSTSTGILLSLFIEKPFLKLREYLFMQRVVT
jgi:peptidoglycan/LPS O-acetylase OafA/YrhL